MTFSITSRSIWLCAFALVLAALPAYPQVTLTGAIQFSTDSNGAGSPGGSEIWNTLGGEHYWDLWLALDPDAISPVNGPSDGQAGINIPVAAGNSYIYYIFGAPGSSTGFNALNLFFDGNNSTPAISAFGATNSSTFVPNGSSTLTLSGAAVPGSGRGFFSFGGVVAVLTAYNWHTPATPPGDVCQPYAFAPGGGVSFFGSFTLQVFSAATLTMSPTSASPGTMLTLTGSGFAPMEKIGIYFGRFTIRQPLTTITDSTGAFMITALLPQAPNGPEDVYAGGQTSGKVGAASILVTAGLLITPGTASPDAIVKAQGAGFGAREEVDVYWDHPQLYLGTATANSSGSFVGSSALQITIPPNARPGPNSVTATGRTTGASATAKVTVR